MHYSLNKVFHLLHKVRSGPGKQLAMPPREKHIISHKCQYATTVSAYTPVLRWQNRHSTKMVSYIQLYTSASKGALQSANFHLVYSHNNYFIAVRSIEKQTCRYVYNSPQICDTETLKTAHDTVMACKKFRVQYMHNMCPTHILHDKCTCFIAGVWQIHESKNIKSLNMLRKLVKLVTKSNFLYT